VEEIVGLPWGLFFGMVTPSNLVEVNHPSPHDPVLLTQQLHWKLGVG
jgi:hypothetical protein